MLTSKVLLLDTKVGNIQSVANVLDYIGVPFQISSDEKALKTASKIIFPGVGAYGVATESLRKNGLFDPLRAALAERSVPCLGICLGMQIMADMGHEFGEHPGLGVIPGIVRRINSKKEGLRLPHVGWNSIQAKSSARLFKSIPENSNFYFLHSYYFDAASEEDVSAKVTYGAPFTAAIEKGNIFGVQFHPEKSQEFGIQIFKNFMDL